MSVDNEFVATFGETQMVSIGIPGEKGDKGDPGKDGVSVTHKWHGSVLTITSASGTSSADLKGDKGDTGATGAKGEKGDKGDRGATGATGAAGADYVLTDDDKQEIAELAAELVPSGGGTSETWADDLLASGTLVANNAVLYDTGITLAKLREYKTFVYKLKGASNTSLSNLYLKLGANETEAGSSNKGVSIDRESNAGRIAYFEWADAEKTVLRPVNGYSGNSSMVALGAHAQSSAQAQVCYGVGQANVMMYIDLSARAETDKLFFYCTATPTIDYSFEIRGLTK